MLKAIHKKQYNQRIKPFKIGFRTLPIISGVTLAGVLAVSGFIPAVTSSAVYAEGSSSGTVDLTANVSEPALALTLSSNAVTLNLSPSYQGEATSSGYITTTVSAGTSGYSLLMYGEPNLVNSDNTTVKITPDSNCLSQGCSLANMASGTWGFGVGENTDISTYKPMTSGYNVIDARASATTSDSITKVVKFGAKVNHEQLPGTYNTTLNFVAVARVNNANPTMQNLNSTYCNSVGPTLVTDSRDNKEYLVQELKDGECWMLDNLALDPTDTNTTINATNTNADETTLGYFKNGGGTSEIEGGKYASSRVVANPNATATAGLWGPTIGESTCNALEDQSICTDNWTIPRVNTSNISNHQYPAWSNDPNYPSYGSYNIGVYYNYCAASAGSYCYAKEQGTGNATSDICPAGWRLPTGGSSGEFQNLYNAYDATAVNGINGYAFRAALAAPLSGNVNVLTGTVTNVDSSTTWWSSIRYDDKNMRTLDITATNINLSGSRRAYGLSIRCTLK